MTPLKRIADAWILTLVTAFAIAPSIARAADDEPVAIPYRPSVSTPAALSAPGWIEIEAGLAHEHDGGGTYRDSVPATVKLAFSPDWGVRVGADAWVRQRDGGGSRLGGVGDTAFVLKRRFALDDDHSLGLEAAAIVPTARRGLGGGQAGYGINAIYSGDFGRWHADVNLVATRLGAPDPDTSRLQWLGAAALSTPLDDHWGVVGELSGTNQRGVDATRQLLLAASYNVSKRLLLDAGAARSLRSGAPTWTAFTGFTWTAARLF